MGVKSAKSRLLFVTPAISDLTAVGSGDSGGKMAVAETTPTDSFALISNLSGRAVEIHVAIPYYRAIFQSRYERKINERLAFLKTKIPPERIHFARDRAFYYLSSVHPVSAFKAMTISIAFQREVANHIEPIVHPDFIFCHDWMTGLIPALARKMDIPCLFAFSRLTSGTCSLARIEDSGIDTAFFWQQLYYQRMPFNYEETREFNEVDFLLSGMYAAYQVMAIGSEAALEIDRSVNGHPNTPLRQLIQERFKKGSISNICEKWDGAQMDARPLIG